MVKSFSGEQINCPEYTYNNFRRYTGRTNQESTLAVSYRHGRQSVTWWLMQNETATTRFSSEIALIIHDEVVARRDQIDCCALGGVRQRIHFPLLDRETIAIPMSQMDQLNLMGILRPAIIFANEDLKELRKTSFQGNRITGIPSNSTAHFQEKKPLVPRCNISVLLSIDIILSISS